ncbi:MAG: hypothetical protein IPK08_16300 [Bacteroidetes bacterium]|nr:hypothetical protein [Bacteroidota bacterium]
MALYPESHSPTLWRIRIFKVVSNVLSISISKGMVRGKRQAIDSAFSKANASLDSLIEKPVLDEDAEAAVMDDAKDFATELNQSTDAFINAPKPFQ